MRTYIVKSKGLHQVLFFYDGTGFTWDAKTEWDRPVFFSSYHFAQRVATFYGAEVVEWKGLQS